MPRDVATRAIFKVVYEHNLGIDGKPMVYLDLTHIDRKILDRKLEGILEIYEKFVGDDPRDTPMKIFPGMHYTMGGLWVDFNQATNIPGIFAAGECEYQYHGANRLGANSLVSCIYGGGIAGPNAVKYARGLQDPTDGNGYFEAEQKRQEEINANLMKSDGTENPVRLWRELGELMTKDCTVIRYNKNLAADRCEAGRVAGALSQDQSERPHPVGEHDGRFCPAALQHDAVGAGDRAGSGHARRIPRRTLQARLPRARRQEFPEDDEGIFRAGRGRAQVRVRARGYVADSAAAEEVLISNF